MIFNSLNLRTYNGFNTFNINPEVEVKVLQYLPIEDKNDIIHFTLQNSEENGIYNELKINMYFHLYITYMYTDLEFTVEEKNDPVTLYNILKSNGIIGAIVDAIPEQEYKQLLATLDIMLERKMKYKNTVASVLNNFIENLPKNAKEAQEIIEKFNPEDLQRVLDFARAANGGREIN